MSDPTPSLVEMATETVTVHATLDGDGELRVEAQGEVRLDDRFRYHRVRIECTLRSGDGRIVVRDDSRLDLDYVVDGRANFSSRVYVPARLADQPETIEMRVSATVIEVDKPITMPIVRC